MEQADRKNYWIFIDNSNLIIGGWQYYARKNKLIPGIQQDKRMRLDTGKLVGHITPEAEREAYLYGSEPPALDTIWRAIEEQDIEVRKFQKSHRGKEKEVDTALSFDAGIVAGRNCKKGGTFVFISGDRDYKYCVERVLEYGFQVMMYSWRSCISNDFKKLAMKEAEKVKKEEEKAKKEGKKAAKIENRLSIVYLDNIVEEWPNTIFFNAEWNTKDIQGSLNPIPAERTIIIQFHTSPTRHTKKLAASKREIEEVTQQLGIPFYYHWTWGSSDDREYASNTASKENDGKRQLLIIFGPRESSDRIEDNMDESYLLENNYIDVEGGVKNAPKSKKLYDFTKIYLKQRDWIRQYFAKFGNVELVVDYVSFHNQASPNIPSTSYDQELTEDEGGWTLVHAKSKNKIYQRSSNPCEMGRRCPKGGKCEHKHSDEEREYFKKHPDGKIRMTRKTRICIDYCQKTEQRSGIKGCRYSKDQCNYAHGESDAYCYMCGVEGDHFACDCPENTS